MWGTSQVVSLFLEEIHFEKQYLRRTKTRPVVGFYVRLLFSLLGWCSTSIDLGEVLTVSRDVAAQPSMGAKEKQ